MCVRPWAAVVWASHPPSLSGLGPAPPAADASPDRWKLGQKERKAKKESGCRHIDGLVEREQEQEEYKYITIIPINRRVGWETQIRSQTYEEADVNV